MSPTGTTMVGAQPLEALPEAPRRETDRVVDAVTIRACRSCRCGFDPTTDAALTDTCPACLRHRERQGRKLLSCVGGCGMSADVTGTGPEYAPQGWTRESIDRIACDACRYRSDQRPRRMSDVEASQWRADMIASLAMWREPDGFLCPTEPEPEERARIRERLTTAIDVLNRVLGDTHKPEPTP